MADKKQKERDRKIKERRKMQLRQKFPTRMKNKLVWLFCLIVLLFCGLIVRMMWINKEKGVQYEKQILSQQKYDSITIPYRRGDILDCNGTSLAVSEKVYNLVIDSKVMHAKEGKYLDTTIEALEECFPQLNMAEVKQYIKENPSSSYYVPLKRMSYTDISEFKKLQSDTKKDADGNPGRGTLIKGVWFEEEYRRSYPCDSLACDVIGFTTADGVGMYGLEEYYNSVLSGMNGREFGYLNGDANLERTTKPAVDGNTIVSTIDANIQGIVEEKLNAFCKDYENGYKDGPAANNIGCIVMDVNSGEILAMASGPKTFNLNKPFDLSAYYSEEEIQTMKESETYYDTLNSIWRNFCISDSYEPGSTFKPFTVAMGLENGAIHDKDEFQCGGYLTVGGHDIHCHNRVGDGSVTVKHAVASSCNVALMKISFAVGVDTFAEYQKNFNFGLKTNIDLAGESRTADLVHGADKMVQTDLAIGSFGQGFNVSMIQMITGFSALVNGGYYYEPHMVKQIRTTGGAVVKNIEPRVLKQVISESTSAYIREYCTAVCQPDYTGNTGKSARPAGYSIGGKTGTAQTLPRGNGEYVVSFIGFAPSDDPQIAIYVVIDRPNMPDQTGGTRQAAIITRNILTEVLPYMGIFMTEELSKKELEELEQKQFEDTRKYSVPVVTGEEESTPKDHGIMSVEPAWKSFPLDEEKGVLVDPITGEYLDPDTGHVIGDYDAIE
ncbi:MAG: penicillin-binding protein 2 [Lachnospiraceae bacterium]|nr:penicillin-binding protein 2 [Lachnospiraceae bacterium]